MCKQDATLVRSNFLPKAHRK